ncbi:hypothetical protein Sjap_023424 [Stephania japonica]|uniref:Membrane insertase YidC/Oxa/ALB C-terminal domain-containing protein n=1 Tax=Stephania japonica TaxID=461633 RepID=A0AAP0EEN5_9MAGN
MRFSISKPLSLWSINISHSGLSSPSTTYLKTRVYEFVELKLGFTKMEGFLTFQSHSIALKPSIQPHNTILASPNRTRFNFGFSNRKPSLRSSNSFVRFSMSSPMPPELPESIDGWVHDVFGRVEGLVHTIADAAVASSAGSVGGEKQSGDWLSGVANLMESVLKVLKDGLSALHVPYSYGFAIILLTVLVKAVTFPLTKKQVESAMAMRSLQPQVKAVQQRYAGDQERIQRETARLYKLAGVNPLAGCLPTLATIPVWIGLYRALSNVANEGLLTEGFFWIPSLAGPTTIASKQNGSGFSWLFPFVDGQPPLGWSDTLAYLVLPVLLVASQYVSVQIMQSSQVNDPNMKNSQAITKFLPLMIGYFALSVPSGLSLYWLTNNILSTTQQVWFQKLGGAKDPVKQLSEEFAEVEKQKLQQSAVDLNLNKASESSEDKSTPDGLRPGERFKQLKEQEARKRQQREEEKRKAAAQGSEVINEVHKNEKPTIKAEDEITSSDSIDIEDATARHSYAEHSSKDQTEVPESLIENGGFAGDNKVDGTNGQHSFENLNKAGGEVEIHTSANSANATVSGEDAQAQHEKFKQPTQRYED